MPRPSNIDLINGSDDDSVMSNVMNMKILKDPTAYSKDELVEMLKNARISRMSSMKGYAPKGNGKPHHSQTSLLHLKLRTNWSRCCRTNFPHCLMICDAAFHCLWVRNPSWKTYVKYAHSAAFPRFFPSPSSSPSPPSSV